jgi:hypothetical protein
MNGMVGSISYIIILSTGITSLTGWNGITTITPSSLTWEISSNPKLSSIVGLANVQGSVSGLSITNNPALLWFGGAFNGITSIGAQGLYLLNNRALCDISFASLSSVYSFINMESVAGNVTFTFPSLEWIRGSLIILKTSITGLNDTSFPLLSFLGADLTIQSNPSLLMIDGAFNSLKQLSHVRTTGLTLLSNAALVTLNNSFTNLVNTSGILIQTSASLTTISSSFQRVQNISGPAQTASVLISGTSITHLEYMFNNVYNSAGYLTIVSNITRVILMPLLIHLSAALLMTPFDGVFIVIKPLLNKDYLVLH